MLLVGYTWLIETNIYAVNIPISVINYRGEYRELVALAFRTFDKPPGIEQLLGYSARNISTAISDAERIAAGCKKLVVEGG